jgi:hypothetical protein
LAAGITMLVTALVSLLSQTRDYSLWRDRQS